MNARRALLLWRRVQCEPELRRAVFAVDAGDLVARFGLGQDELDVVRHLRDHQRAAMNGVQAFHGRLAKSVTRFVRSYCPLTASLLVARGHDLHDLVRRYNQATGFRDDGPYFFRCCASFLSYVAAETELPAAVQGLADALRVEQSKLAMLRALAGVPESSWRALPAALPVAETVRYQRTPNGVVVAVAHDITALLVDPEEGARAAMESGALNILIYLKSTAEQVGFGVLNDTARSIFDALDRPATVA